MRNKIVITSVIIFLIGVATGIFLDRIISGKRYSYKTNDMKEKMLKKFTRELKLSKEQQDKISAILDKHYDEISKLRQSLRETMREAIREHLTPEQQEKFNEIVKKWDERHK